MVMFTFFLTPLAKHDVDEAIGLKIHVTTIQLSKM